jgi:MFS family permease
VAACVFIVSTIILLFIHAQPVERHNPESPPPNLVSNRRYLGFMGLVVVVLFATYLPQPLTQNFLQNERGLNLSQIGMLGSINSFGIVVLNLGLGQLSARVGFILGQAAVALFTLFLWQGTGMVWYALGYFLLSGYRVIRPLTSAQVRELIHGSQMGLAYGVTEAIGSVPVIIAPLIAGILYAFEPILVYPISFVLILVGMMLSYFYGPRFPAPPPAALMASDAPMEIPSRGIDD